MNKKILFALFLFCSAVGAQEKLVLIGGGPRPEAALRQFAEWAEQKNVLIIAWASEVPQEAGESVAASLRPFYKGEIQFALNSPTDAVSREIFKNQLASATGVFFTGGSQTRIMKNFDGEGAQLEDLLRTAYKSGIVFGGTSAGTAIMSSIMITGGTGENVQTARGLGFISTDKKRFILDQHFSQRNRQQRLIKAMNKTGTPDGLGVDENTAIVVENRTSLKVVGTNAVTVFSMTASGEVSLQTLHAGDTLDLDFVSEK